MQYFFDIYALIELTKNNPNYLQYSDEIVATTLFNLAELYYSIIRDFNEEKAKGIYFRFKECEIEISDDTIFEAMKLKLKLKNKKLSYTDCIGYTFALKNNLKFLTGDSEFEDMENVEFVK